MNKESSLCSIKELIPFFLSYSVFSRSILTIRWRNRRGRFVREERLALSDIEYIFIKWAETHVRMGCEGRALEWCYSPSQPGTSTFLFFFWGNRVFVEAGIREIGPFEVRAKLWCHSPKLRVKKALFLNIIYLYLFHLLPTAWWKGVGSFANSFIAGSLPTLT